MTDPKSSLASRYLQRLLPEDSSPRLHHMYDDPDKASRMLQKSLKKFKFESSLIKDQIDFEFLEKIRKSYRPKKRIATLRLPKLDSTTKAPKLRSNSTLAQHQLRFCKQSSSPLKPSESRLAHLDSLLLNYSAIETVDKTAQMSALNKSTVASLKQRMDWAADYEASRFNE